MITWESSEQNVHIQDVGPHNCQLKGALQNKNLSNNKLQKGSLNGYATFVHIHVFKSNLK